MKLRRRPPARLTKRIQFLHVRQGVRAARPSLVLEARLQAQNGPPRVGFTATRKIGGAVTRNRARRRLKEAVRLLAAEGALPANLDLVFIARQDTASVPFQRLLDDMKSALLRVQADLSKASSQPPRGESESYDAS